MGSKSCFGQGLYLKIGGILSQIVPFDKLLSYEAKEVSFHFQIYSTQKHVQTISIDGDDNNDNNTEPSFGLNTKKLICNCICWDIFVWHTRGDIAERREPDFGRGCSPILLEAKIIFSSSSILFLNAHYKNVQKLI